jgi:polar amino acid transport system substrate-binding protein
MVINQAMGVPKARPEFEKTTLYLSEVITQLKQSGFIANSLQRHHIQGAKVAD